MGSADRLQKCASNIVCAALAVDLLDAPAVPGGGVLLGANSCRRYSGVRVRDALQQMHRLGPAWRLGNAHPFETGPHRRGSAACEALPNSVGFPRPRKGIRRVPSCACALTNAANYQLMLGAWCPRWVNESHLRQSMQQLSCDTVRLHATPYDSLRPTAQAFTRHRGFSVSAPAKRRISVAGALSSRRDCGQELRPGAEGHTYSPRSFQAACRKP